MKKKIKLRDLTEEQYEKWLSTKCKGNCNKCLFNYVYCDLTWDNCWINNKDLYSDKFLDQEVEIEIPELLTKEEKEYLENLLKPFKEVIDYIEKRNSYSFHRKLEYICIRLCNGEYITLPYFNCNEYYKNLEIEKEYSIEELGLFEEKKYKITLTEFRNSEEKLAIHCDTKEKADKLLKAFDKLGKKWPNGSSYLKHNGYEFYKEKTCYCNESEYCDLEFYREINFTIYEFEDVDLEH